MKKKTLSLALALVMCLGLAVQVSAVVQITPEQVYNAMVALKTQYPEGMSWTNSNTYDWRGGIFSGGGGCAAFAFILSDAAFGDFQARMLETFSYADVRVGDILFVNGGNHVVIVLEVYSDHVIIAEGNYNNSIHWGRSISKSNVLKAGLMTRYPEAMENPILTQPESLDNLNPTISPVEHIPASGTAIASTQTVTVDSETIEFQMYALADANGNLTNYIKLRDMAYVLNATPSQFSVGYDGTISLTTGQPYEASGTEMTTPFSGDRAYTGGAQTLKIDGKDVAMTAITLTDDNGGGYNYFKLRDLGKALGFNVGYSNENGVFIESGKPYTE